MTYHTIIKWTLLLLLFTAPELIDAQTNSTDSYKTIAAGEPSKLERFLQTFEIANVGNLHVYSTSQKKDSSDYYFKGEPIDVGFRNFLPYRLQKKLIDGKKVFAVYQIKGADANDFYIVRENVKRSPNQITLYHLNSTQLLPVQTLSYNKKRLLGGYLQMNTWIQDVNGDTKLDLIQKSRKVTKKGKVKNEVTKVFLQTENGALIFSENTPVDAADYLF